MGGDACRHFKVPHLHAVADYVGGERQHGHQQALIDYIHAQSAREYGVAAVSWRAMHGVGLGGLKAQCQRGEAVGYQVDKEQMHGAQQREAEYGGEKHA